MHYRQLGRTGIAVSSISFGAGPVSQLLVGEGDEQQRQTVERAIELGINWFDTAATYGEGRSEANLGRVLEDLQSSRNVHVATKVRILPDQHDRIAAAVRESVLGSLTRLRLKRVTLLQLHNSITRVAGAEPTSLAPEQVLGPGGVLEAMEALRSEGLVSYFGLTGIGEPAALATVISSGAFATIQIPYNLLNPTAGLAAPPGFSETNHGNLLTLCQQLGMGAFAIRVLAGGALAGRPPSPHTLKTPFFPLALFERDRARAEQLREVLPPGLQREEAALRFAVSHPAVTSAIVGLGSPDEVNAAVAYADRGELDAKLIERLNERALSSETNRS